MSAVHGKTAKALLNAVDVKNYLQKISLSISADVPEDTGLGPSGDFRTRVAGGMLDGSLSFSGVYMDAAGADTTFRAALGAEPGHWIVAPDGFTAVGEIVWAMNSIMNSYSFSSPAEGIVATDGGADADDGVRLAYLLHTLSSATATGTGNGVDLGAGAPYSAGCIGALHVTAAAGTTPTLDVVIETASDASFTTPTTLVTFTQATGVTSEMKVSSTQVQRYIRAKWTIGGTNPDFTFVAALAVK